MSRCLLRGVDEAVYGVHGARPFTVEGFIDEHKKGGDGVVVVLVEHEGIEDPIEVRRALELGNAAVHKQRKECQQEVGIAAKDQESAHAEFLELQIAGPRRLRTPHHGRHVWRKYEGRGFSLDAEFGFEVAQKVAKVNVKQPAIFGQLYALNRSMHTKQKR